MLRLSGLCILCVMVTLCSALKIYTKRFEEVLDETMNHTMDIDITDSCQSIIEAAQKICSSFKDHTSLIQMEFRCAEFDFLKSILETQCGFINCSLSKNLVCKNRRKRFFHLPSTDLPHLQQLIYHNVLESVVDIMLHWKRYQGVFIVDKYSGLNPSQARNYIRNRGVKATIVYLPFDVTNDALEIIVNAAKEQNNFIVICNHLNTNVLMNKIKPHGLLAGPFTWIVAAESIPESVLGYDITPDMQFTLMAPRYEAFPWKDFFSSKENFIFFKKHVADTKDAEQCFCQRLDKTTKFHFITMDENTYPAYFSLAPNVDLRDVFFSVASNQTESVRFARWNQVNKLFLLEFLDNSDNKRRLCGRRIRMSVFQHEPYTFFKRKGNALQITGYLKEMTDMLIETFNIRYTLFETEEVFGVYNETTKTFDGFVGYLWRKEADMGINVLGATLSRSRGVRYVGPVTKAYLAIVYNRPDAVMPATTYLLPFSYQVWLVGLTFLMVIVVTTFIVMLTSPSYLANKNQSQLVHKPSFRAITFTFLEEVFEYPPGVSAKVVYGTMAVATLIIFAHYTSVFTSFLTYQEEKVPFKSLEDVVRNKEYQVLMVKNGRHQDLFKSAQSGVYADVWKRIKKQGDKSFEYSFASGLYKSYTGKYAYLSDGPTCTFLSKGNCSVAFAPAKYYHEFYNMAHRLDFPYSRLFTLGLMQIMESGIFRRLTLTYNLENKSPCRFGGNSTLGLQQVIGIFVLLGFGIALSMLTVFVERALSPKWAMTKDFHQQINNLGRRKKEKRKNGIVYVPTPYNIERPKL